MDRTASQGTLSSAPVSRGRLQHVAHLVAAVSIMAIAPPIMSCQGPAHVISMEEAVTVNDWQALRTRRVLFGHQSVGQDVLEGVRTLAAEGGIPVPMEESRVVNGAASIVHFKVGQNGQPLSKIEDFRTVLDSGFGSGADIAMMKLCYIDFDAQTDGAELARQYVAVLEGLAARHDAIRLVAVTAPLTTHQRGPRAWLKKLLGRVPGGHAENARRADFNEYVRLHTQADQLFDLARVESAGSSFPYGGRQVESLHPALTDDGGHLNANGRRVVASAFIRFIARVPLATP